MTVIDKIYVLGASDPEMQEIENLLHAANQCVAYEAGGGADLLPQQSAAHFAGGKMTEITYDQLKAAGACRAGLREFKARFGERTDVTPDICASVADYFDWNWASNTFLNRHALMIYAKAKVRAHLDYGIAVGYALRVRHETLKQHANDEIAKQVCNEAVISAQHTYNETSARAFAEAYISDHCNAQSL